MILFDSMLTCGGGGIYSLNHAWLFMDCSLSGSSVHEISQARILNGLPFLSLEDLPDPQREPTSPKLQKDSLPLNHQGAPTMEPTYKFYTFPKLTRILSEDGVTLWQPTHKHSCVLSNNSTTIRGGWRACGWKSRWELQLQQDNLPND